MVADVKEKFGKEIPVDDIVIIKIKARGFMEIFRKWVGDGRPSGGPEHFLPNELKIKLLKEATRGLVKIEDEDIKKCFGD